MKLFTRTLLLSVAATPLVLGASMASAQSAAAPEGDEAAKEEIIVTGSLIRRPNNTSVSPIATLSAETIKESGRANIVDALEVSGRAG